MKRSFYCYVFLCFFLVPSSYFCKVNPSAPSSLYTPSSLRKFPSSASTPLTPPKKRPLSEYSIYSLYTQNSPADLDRDKQVAQEREQLYEAYNLLHSLAQDFHKPFDAPAVIVVGHQTSGKSALIEALMGFQFNQVGGGTKTRRPIALRMQYNPNCITPLCFLTLENGKEEQRSLSDIQAYIEAENKRLERDSTRSFDPREINIRMEYRYCPNMIVIDTPGMIHPPKGRQLTPQQRALAIASREAENLVLSKIRCQDYIILCVEDTTDWKHATTRNVVMQADPNLERTVLVTTKLDTKLPQFSEAEDLEDFLRAPLIQALFSQMLGGPFFTSVPSGRVGSSSRGGFDSNDAFVQSLKKAERADRSFIFNKLGRPKAMTALANVGVSRLRAFLEQRIEETYRRNVAKIVPLLQQELRHTEQKLAATEQELQSLSLERLHQMANHFREKFAKELSQVIQGTVRISPEEWGETLETEQMKGGTFLTPGDSNYQLSNEHWQQILANEVGNNHNKLLGGAQYHRAIREFTMAVRHMAPPPITEDEISNAAGMTDTHNGVNFMRAACVIAMEKAEVSFDPMLEALRIRTEHIMKRIYPMVVKLLERSMANTPMDINNRPFQEVLRRIYDTFVEKSLEDCLRICREDLHGMTRFVTWDLEDKSGASQLYRLLPTPRKMVEVWQLAAKRIKQKREEGDLDEDFEVDEEAETDLETEEDDEEEEIEAKVLQLANKKKGLPDKQQPSKKGGGNLVTNLFDWNRKSTPPTTTNKKGKKSNTLKRNSKSSTSNKKLQTKGGARSTTSSAPANSRNSNNKMVPVSPASNDYTVSAVEEDAVLSDYYKVMQLTEEMLSGSSPNRTSALVSALVQFIISSWRNHFARSTAMKFNCYFLMPFLEKFPIYLRDELDRMYKDGMAEMFDIAETRRALLARRAELMAEKDANSKLQQRFQQIATQLKTAAFGGGSAASATTLENEESEEMRYHQEDQVEEDPEMNFYQQQFQHEVDSLEENLSHINDRYQQQQQRQPPSTPQRPQRSSAPPSPSHANIVEDNFDLSSPPSNRQPTTTNTRSKGRSPTSPRSGSSTLKPSDINELDDLYSTSFSGSSSESDRPKRRPPPSETSETSRDDEQ